MVYICRDRDRQRERERSKEGEGSIACRVIRIHIKSDRKQTLPQTNRDRQT